MILEYRISYRPWVYFLLWASISFLLSYSSLSIGFKLGLGLFGIILPLFLALRAVHLLGRPRHSLLELETLSRPPAWVFALLVLAALGLRFWGLTGWPVWPNTDEGLIGRFAVDLCRQWNGRFFYTFGQAPPGMEWFLYCLLPRFSESLQSLWFLPAALSFLAAILSYWAFRSFLSKSMAFLVFVLWSVSFWPLFSGRFCHQGVLLSPWALLVLAVLGFFLKSGKPFLKFWMAVFLGVVTGLGSFTFTPWVTFGFWIFMLVTAVTLMGAKKNRKYFWGFLAALAVTLLPFLLAVVKEGFGQHLFAVSSLRGYRPLGDQIIAVLSYLTAPFWGVFEDQSAYGPVWGGMLNPFLTSAFLVGLVEAYLNRREPKVQWGLFGAALCLLPGLLSMNVEMYRVILVLPFLLFGAALGLHRLLFEIPSARRAVFLAALLLPSLGLDIVHLAHPHLFPLFSKQGVFLGVPPSKPVRSYRAYQILEKQANLGPGLFFSDFTAIPYDQTLNYATYGFNALLNPGIPLEAARWASILVNANYKPFLEKDLPGGQWVRLDEDLGMPDGGLILGIIPMTQKNVGILQKWVQTYPFFRNMDFEWLNLADFMKGSHLLENFSKVKPFLAGDRFLESCYWEKTGEVLYRDRAFPHDLEAYQKAAGEGYPSAHLFYKIGSIQLRKNQFALARENFRKAEKAPLNLTRTGDALRMTDDLEKQGGLPQP